MADDLGAVLTPIADSLAGFITGDKKVDFGDPLAVSSVQQIVDVCDGFNGFARVYGATAEPQVSDVFSVSCEEIQRGIDLVRQKIANPALDYDQHFVAGIRLIGEHISELLRAQTDTYKDRIKQSATAALIAVQWVATAVKGSEDTLVKAATDSKNGIIAFCKAVDGALDQTSQPDKRKAITEHVTVVKQNAPPMIRSAQAAAMARTDESKQQAVAADIKTVESSIIATRRAAIGDEDAMFDVEPTADDAQVGQMLAAGVAVDNMRDAVNRLVELAKSGATPEQLLDAAKAMGMSTMAAAEALRKAAAECDDPKLKQRLLDLADALQNKGKDLLLAAKDCAANPNDAGAQQRLKEATDALLQTMADAKAATQEGSGEKDKFADMSFEEAAKYLENLKGVSGGDLMAASAEAVRLANQMAALARAKADEETDPAKKARILAAADAVEKAAAELLAAQQYAAEHPDDPEAQKRVQEAYNKLCDAITNMVAAVQGDMDAEMLEAMSVMKAAMQGKAASMGAVGDSETTIAIGQGASAKIFEGFLDPGNPPKPKDFVKNAKLVADNVKDFLKQLDALIASTDDPIYKKRLKDLARVIRDRNTQLKIISAVKSSADENDQEAVGAVQAAALGLDTSIKEAIQAANALALRQRVVKAVNTVMAINKVMKAFKKPLNKK